MPTYRITDPATGKSIKITGDSPPTEAEMEQIFAVSGKPSKLSLGDVAGGAFSNALGDVWGVAKSLFKTVTHPLRTGEALTDIGAGAISKFLPASPLDYAEKKIPVALSEKGPGQLSQPGFGDYIENLLSWSSPEDRKKYEAAANQFGEHYKQRYGGWENIKRSIMEHPAETALDVATVITPAAKRIPGFKVGGKGLTEDAKIVAQLAKEKGLPLSASSITPTKTAKAFEFIGEALPPGKGWANLKRQKLQEGLAKMMDDAAGSLPVRAEKFEVGTAIGQGIKQAKKTLKGKEAAAYKKWEGALGDKPKLMDNVTQVIGDLKETATGDMRAWLETYSKKGTEWSVSDIDAFQKQIWTKMGSASREGGELFSALKKDVGPELTVLLEDAKEQGKLLRAFSANDTVRRVMRKYASDPENAIREMFKTGNLDDINIIKSALDKDTWNMARSRFVENLFDASIELIGTQRAFNPQKFSDLFNKYQRQIRQVMPEKYDDLDKFAKLSKASVADLNRMKMSDTMKTWQTVATGGLGYGAITNPLVIVPAGLSFGIAKSIMNPKGWMKNWLTEGINVPSIPLKKAIGTTNVLQIGGREAIRQEEEQ